MAEARPEVSFEVSVDIPEDDDEKRSRPQSQSQSRAGEMVANIKKKEEDVKRAVRARMEAGLRKLLSFHNAVELSSICGLLHMPVQERGHISLQQVLDYAIVGGSVKGDRLKKVLDCCWEEPLVSYIREELNPNFHRAKDPATVVLHWWKEGGLVSDQSLFNPVFVSREVKMVGVGYEGVTSPDLLAKLDELRGVQETMKKAERLMFSVQNYVTIHNYFEQMRLLRKAEVDLREWLINEVEITRVRLDVVDEAVHYALKCEKECDSLNRDVTNMLATRLSEGEIHGVDLLKARFSHENNMLVFQEYLERLIVSCTPFHSAFPDAPFDVPDNASQVSTSMDCLVKSFKLYKWIKDNDGANHISRHHDNDVELTRLEGVRARLEAHLSFLKKKAFWEEQRLESERLALRKLLHDDERRTQTNAFCRQEAWGTSLTFAAKALETQMQKRDLYPLLRQGLLGTSKQIHAWCHEVNDIFEVLDEDTFKQIADIHSMEASEAEMRKFDKALAMSEKKAKAATKKKKDAKDKKAAAKKAGDDGSKGGKSAASSKGSKKSKASKKSGDGDKKEKGAKKKGKKGGGDDDKSTKSGKTGKSGKSAKSEGGKSKGDDKAKGKKKKKK